MIYDVTNIIPTTIYPYEKDFKHELSAKIVLLKGVIYILDDRF